MSLRAHARTGVAVLLLTTLLRMATLFAPFFNPDEAYLATQGHVLAHGGRIYLDTADRKPPIVPLLYAATFELVGHDSLVAIHVLAILFAAATTLVVGALARRFVGPRAARSAMLVFLFASTTYFPTDVLAANFEVFMLLPACAAVLSAGLDRPELDALAGALLAIATLTKQTAAVTALPVLLLLLESPRRGRAIVATAGGALVPIALACRLVDARQMYFWSLGGIPDYLSSTNVLAISLARGAWETFAFFGCHAALVWLVCRVAWQRFSHRRMLWAWLGSSFVAVTAGYRFFGHYYLQLIPAAALLAAHALCALQGRARTRMLFAMAMPACLVAVAGFFNAHIHPSPRYERVAAFVEAHTKVADRVAIWGNEPEVYWASHREPATRIVHTDFLSGVSGGRPEHSAAQPSGALGDALWAQYFADLDAHAPQLFLDASVGGLRHYTFQPLSRYPALATWVAARYREITTIDGVRIYERYGVGLEPSSISW